MMVSNSALALPTTSLNTITIVRTSDFVQHVRPPPRDPPFLPYELPGTTRHDCVYRGLVIVHLPKPKRAKFLKVEHVTTARVPISSRLLENPNDYKTWPCAGMEVPDKKGANWHEEILHRNVMELSGTGDEGILIEAGPQMFEYAFIVPANLAGTDRCRFARIDHHIEATLFGTSETSPLGFGRKNDTTLLSRLAPPKSSSPLADTKMPSQFQDVAADARLTKTTWLRGTMSTTAGVLLIPLQTPDGLPLPLEHNTTKIIPNLGMVDWGAHADAFTVGGQMIVRFALEQPYPLVSVWAIKFHINQVVTIETPDTKDKSKDPVSITDNYLLYAKGFLPQPKEMRARDGSRGLAEPLWEGDAVPGPQQYKDMRRLETDEYIRVPDEDKLRPTTCPGTITPLRMAHEISLQIFFSVWGEDANGQSIPEGGPGQLRKAVLIHNAAISSCTCTSENLALPVYEAEPTQGGRRAPTNVHDAFARCACTSAVRRRPVRLSPTVTPTPVSNKSV